MYRVSAGVRVRVVVSVNVSLQEKLSLTFSPGLNKEEPSLGYFVVTVPFEFTAPRMKIGLELSTQTVPESIAASAIHSPLADGNRDVM